MLNKELLQNGRNYASKLCFTNLMDPKLIRIFNLLGSMKINDKE